LHCLVEEEAVKLAAFLSLLLIGCAALAQAPPAQKPLDKDQVMALVAAGMDSAQLAKRVEERGIDFVPTDDYLEALRKAGAQDVLLRALRPPKAEPMNRQQVLQLVAGGVPPERATALVKQRGIDFAPDEKYLETLRVAGADEGLVAAVREAGGAIPGNLEVSTEPNAEVYLDGALAGHADSHGSLTVSKVKAGAHALRVTAASKNPFEQTVIVAPTTTNKVAATLTSLPAKVTIASTSGAQVYVDGTDRGKTDSGGKLLLVDVSPGGHQVKVTAQANRKDYSGSFTLSAGQELTVYALGEPSPGRLCLHATPGALLYVDDARPMVVYANGEVILTSMSPGQHRVRIVTEGVAEFQRDVIVQTGQETVLDAPRGNPPASGMHIDRLYRSLTPSDNGFWFYLKFDSDGVVTLLGSKGSLSDARRELDEHKGKDLESYIYQMQGSTIRFPRNGWLGIEQKTCTLRGNKLTYETVNATGNRTSDVLQAVDSEAGRGAGRQ
jgi:hypothetical protein